MSSVPELWAGAECTHNRVRDRYFDQMDSTGHSSRLGDLERIASLGAKAVRLPVLWERVEELGDSEWARVDSQVAECSRLELRPIIGLVHHGSGPRSTDLLDPAFPEKLAQFASLVANRYPQVADFTPVNEPLTTARFSGLYGHWYPHHRCDESFTRALLTQCRAVATAMQAIRAVNPDARLIQTEDLGHTRSTTNLRYQADFDNERRWLSLDLLCGRVGEAHPLWAYLLERGGVSTDEITWFARNRCQPDVCGFNYYLTSERFLHEQPWRFPSHLRGGNGLHEYADVEAARICGDGLLGSGKLLMQAWQRYQLPLAITECHNGCTREEQMRWTVETWKGCHDAIAQGADVRAFTAWMVFGGVDWDSLATAGRNHYESGIFDLRAPQPRPTALASIYRVLARGEMPNHPVLQERGWWHRRQRFCFEVTVAGAPSFSRVVSLENRTPQPVLLVRPDRAIAPHVRSDCEFRGLSCETWNPGEPIESCLSRLQPWAVVDFCAVAGQVRDKQETAAILSACLSRHLPFAAVTSEAVFGGRKDRVYMESDVPCVPCGGNEHQLRYEEMVQRAHDNALIIRTSAWFGGDSNPESPWSAVRALSSERHATPGRILSPTYIPDLTRNLLDLLIDGETGVVHLTSGVRRTEDFLAALNERLNLDSNSVAVANGRSASAALASERVWVMPSLESALDRYCDNLSRRLPLERAA